MNSNTLGIVAVSVVALAGIATVAWQNGRNKSDHVRNIQAEGAGDTPAYGIYLEIDLDQWNAIKAVLEKTSTVFSGANRETLYRVRSFVKGTPVLPSPPPTPGQPDEKFDEGELPVDLLIVDRSKIIDRQKAKQFTGYAFQIGVGGKDSYQKIPSNVPNMPQAQGKTNMRESREMVEEVYAILYLQ